ncbi:MAG: Glycogen synthase [Parcubacteria group bacterium GW2011_GWC1_41_7]|nr:MAG: Glycogen synthase [Parcubacteria group bacterium GW2011_GWC1_41_7]
MNRFLLEASWEVANKVGGIHTVLKEKAPFIKEKFGDEYLVIGPYVKDTGFQEFNALQLPPLFKEVVEETEKFGIHVFYGEWLVEGRPRGFLIDFNELMMKANMFKYELWDVFKIDSTRTGRDYEEPITWAKATSIFLKHFCQHFTGRKIVIHTHEWLAGSILLFEKFNTLPSVSTVFTTHATVLGRSLASAGVNFWETFSSIKPDEEAKRYGVEARHGIEKYAAQYARIFSTVSSPLTIEAHHFLGRKPDAILPNGLDFKRFPTVEEMAHAHRKYRESIREFILFFFSPYFRVETSNSIQLFISGRPEIKNKGIDVYIKALGRLNKKLGKDDKNVYAFIFVPGETRDIDHTLAHNLSLYRNIEERIDEMTNELKSRLLHYLVHKKQARTGGLFTKDEFVEFAKMFSSIRHESDIPLSTHIPSPNDPIMKLLRLENLTNAKDDKVKIIYYPSYLSSTDGLLNINYEDAVSGFHLGVFPSFYEPWGYTPLESSASGVLTITTDTTGFADFLQKHTKQSNKNPGIFIIGRKGRTDTATVQLVTDVMQKIVRLNKQDRVENKLEARRLAQSCEWKKLISYYFEMYKKLLP